MILGLGDYRWTVPRRLKGADKVVGHYRPAHTWTDVDNVPFQGAPRLPKTRPNGEPGEPWPPSAKAKWRAWSRMPHCCLWTPSDWDFAVDSLEVAVLFHESGSTAWAAELRHREKVLGTTRDALSDLRIRYEPLKPVLTVVAASAVYYREL